MINYCTLFDKNYLSRGLALYSSLLNHLEDFHLYIYTLDDTCLEALNNLNLSRATIISSSDFEDERLLEVKKDRTNAEYCWTCTPSIILHSLETYNLQDCTYVDADIFFFSSPMTIHNESANYSISLTEHHYSDPSAQQKIRGKYCVQYMKFQNDQYGLDALIWWRNKCLEWCYSYYEDGKFGDQLYLDDWLTRFRNVCVIKNKGAGIAPWNMDQYIYKKNLKEVVASEKKSNLLIPIVFFHFHSFKIYQNNTVKLSYYPMSKDVVEAVYTKYVNAIIESEKSIMNISNLAIENLRDVMTNRGFLNTLREQKHKFFKIHNLYSLKKFSSRYG